MKIYITDKSVEEYMDQFNVDRETAITEIKEIMKDFMAEQDKLLQETYASIKKM